MINFLKIITRVYNNLQNLSPFMQNWWSFIQAFAVIFPLYGGKRATK